MVTRTFFCLFTFCSFLFFSAQITNGAVIIDHNHTDITVIPQAAIEQAKNNLHIAYGHTSHGSQLTSGMSGLVAFANGGGLGLAHPDNIFAWNNGGTGGALDLHDGAMGGDVGYYPAWVNNTRDYLDNLANSDVNVIIWSWCGQVDAKYADGVLQSEYLDPMAQLESDYPGVTFVYMTGHVDIWDDANNKAANQMIRDYCIANNKVLYDFADIERYDPDGNYYEFVSDNCAYYDGVGPGSTQQGNWALEWQASHTEDVDWYDSYAAHSYPLNANRKAYAAWYLWAVLGGWNPNSQAGVTVTESGGSTAATEGGTGDSYEVVLDSLPTSEVTITVTPDGEIDLGSGAATPVVLTFTNANWSRPQTVNVTAYDDDDREGDHSSIITHSSSSSDTNYNGITIDDVTVSITDNDSPAVNITESFGCTAVVEGESTDSYQVVLNTQPTDQVTLTVTPDGQLDLGNGPSTAIELIFTTSDWDIAQTVTVTPVDDLIEEGTHNGTITHEITTSDVDYGAIDVDDIVVRIGENGCLLLRLIPALIESRH